MITDNQVRKLKKYLSQGKTLEVSAARSGMDEKTARKYRDKVLMKNAIYFVTMPDFMSIPCISIFDIPLKLGEHLAKQINSPDRMRVFIHIRAINQLNKRPHIRTEFRICDQKIEKTGSIPTPSITILQLRTLCYNGYS